MDSVKILISYPAIRKRLKQEYHYTEGDVMHTVWRMMKANREVKEAFAGWIKDDNEPRLECEGITWKELVDERGLNSANALLFMDTLMKDPDQGMIMLTGQMRPSMKLDISALRPELRDYVDKKTEEEKENKEKEITPDAEGNIEL